MKKILLIDDDPITHTIIQKALGKEYKVQSSFDLKEAQETHLIKAGAELPDIILLDRGLPDGDGVSLCSNLRSDERLKEIPVIFLSGKDSESDKVVGFFAGGDDYMTKPFGVLELKARIEARLKTKSKVLSLAQIFVDLDSHRVYQVNGQTNVGMAEKQELDLTRIEYRILIAFLQAPDRVMSRDLLMDKVWGSGCAMSDRVVDTHVSHLRKKIKASGLAIEARRGEGYRLVIKSNQQSLAA